MKAVSIFTAVVMASCSCAPSRILIKEACLKDDYALSQNPFLLAYDADTLVRSSPDPVTAHNSAGWLRFYGIDKEVFLKILEAHCPVITRVALYESDNAYKILVETHKNIADSARKMKGWLVLSVQLMSNKYPFLKGVHGKTALSILYSTPDMKQALLLVGSVGGVEVVPGKKEPLWRCKLRLLQRLPMRVEEKKAIFLLPKQLLVKDAQITDVWARVHMMIPPGKPLTCDIPDLLLLPPVNELHTIGGCTFVNFNILWNLGKAWGEGVPVEDN